MTDLFSPGDHRAGELMSDRALVLALARVERAWYAVLVGSGIAPDVEWSASSTLSELSDAELSDLAEAAEAGGNPVIPVLGLLRQRVGEPGSSWLHRGLTSQDVFDTAMILLLRDVLDALVRELREQVATLRKLINRHRTTLCAGRTLTQPAVPTTFGLVAANWLDGLLDVLREFDALRRELPVQVGGAAGTLAAIELIAPGRAFPLADGLADQLGLEPSQPWHGRRRPLNKITDALVGACDAWGRIANDVLLRSRPEIGELNEGAASGRGGSSTMPHKQNPVLSVLIRRTALNAPLLGAAVHGAAAAAVDQRPDGGWHAEWAPTRTLARQTVVAGSQTTELVGNLVIHAEAMAATARAWSDDLLAEARSISALAGAAAPTELTEYLGANGELIDATLRDAAIVVEDTRP